MLLLETGDTLQAEASSATALTVTVYALEEAAAVQTYKKVYQGQPAATPTVLYTVAASTTALVKTITVTNPTGTARTIKIWHDGSADTNVILPAISIDAGGFATYSDDGWHFYNASGQLKSAGATGADGATGATGAAGLPAPFGRDGDDGNTFVIPGPPGAAGAPGAGGIALSNSETMYTSGTVNISGLGALTLRSTTGNAFQFSVAAQSVQAETQTFLSGIKNTETTYSSGQVELEGTNNITVFSTTGQRFRISGANSHAQQTAISGIGNSETTYTSGTVNLSVVAGALTIRSTTGNAFQFSAGGGAETQVAISGIQNSNTTYTSGTVNFVDLANITIRSTTGQKLEFSVAAPGAAAAKTISIWRNFPEMAGSGAQAGMASSNASAATRSLFVFPLQAQNNLFPGNITVSTARMLLSFSASTASITGSHSMGFSFGVYKVSASNSASTLSLLNSVGTSFTNTTLASAAAVNSLAGVRWLSFHSSQWSSNPVFTEGGLYYGAFISSWSGISLNTGAIYGGYAHSNTLNASGMLNAASATGSTRGIMGPYAGHYSATTDAFPASIHISQLVKTAALDSWAPALWFDMINSDY